MADPISVRHVMATVDVAERVTKAEAAQQQAFGENFANELSKQDALKQTRVARKGENEKILQDGSENSREEEKKRKADSASDENEEQEFVEPEQEHHIIDVQA